MAGPTWPSPLPCPFSSSALDSILSFPQSLSSSSSSSGSEKSGRISVEFPRTLLPEELQEQVEGATINTVSLPSSPMYSDISKASPLVLKVHGSELQPSSNAHEPKARKPYTITKQREKWTEEEHGKFLEALKLYGRTWRRIEEHIGTKTAVQIRSHAQKFFSKMAREPGNNNPDSGEAIAIPPPRPKRKPMHPYPRKFAQLPALKGGTCVARSSSPLEYISEEEKGSPTSVLSAAESDAIGSTVSSPQNDFTFPDSPIAGSSPTSVLNFEQENGCLSSIEDESGSPLPASGLCQADNSSVELDSDDKEKKAPSVGTPITSLKLFGATVLITHPPEPSSNVNDTSQFQKTSMSFTLFGDLEQTATAQQKSEMTLETNCTILKGNILSGFGTCACEQQPWGATQAILGMQFSNEDSKLGVHTTSMPRLCTGAANFCVDVPDEVGGLSYSGLNSCCAGEVSVPEKVAVIIDSEVRETLDNDKELSVFRLKVSKNSAFTKPKKLGSGQRGFVPYKRCMAERDRQPPLGGEEISRQRIKLCL